MHFESKYQIAAERIICLRNPNEKQIARNATFRRSLRISGQLLASRTGALHVGLEVVNLNNEL
jgi:hypothetical protein